MASPSQDTTTKPTPIALMRVAQNIYRYDTKKGRRYLIRVMVLGQPCKRKGFLTQEQASNFITAVRMAAVEAKHLPHLVAAPTLNEYAPQWLAQCRLRDLRPSTLHSYEQHLRDHIQPAQGVDGQPLGEKPLDRITRQDIIAVITAKQAEQRKDGKPKYARDTLRLMLAPLSRLFADAYDSGLIGDHNPCLRPGRIIRARKASREIPAFTAEQETAFLEAAQRVRPDQAVLCWVLFKAGLREGEAIALEPKDIDLKAGRIRVTKNWHKGHLHPTKTSRARQVEIAPDLRPRLEAYFQHHSGKGLLFPGPDGGYWKQERFQRRVWEPILKEAKLPHLTPHSSRHTFATRNLERGCSLQWLSQQLGHSSIQVTVDTYGHLAQKP